MREYTIIIDTIPHGTIHAESFAMAARAAMLLLEIPEAEIIQISRANTIVTFLDCFLDRDNYFVFECKYF